MLSLHLREVVATEVLRADVAAFFAVPVGCEAFERARGFRTTLEVHTLQEWPRAELELARWLARKHAQDVIIAPEGEDDPYEWLLVSMYRTRLRVREVVGDEDEDEDDGVVIEALVPVADAGLRPRAPWAEDDVMYEEDLGGMDLDRCSFGSFAAGSRFDRSRLVGANFKKTQLEAASFVEAVAPRAFFMKAELRQADLSRADLRLACFDRAGAWGARFRDADLRGASLCWTSFEGADLTGAHFDGAWIEHTWVDERTVLAGATGLDDADVFSVRVRDELLVGDEARAWLLSRSGSGG